MSNLRLRMGRAAPAEEDGEIDADFYVASRAELLAAVSAATDATSEIIALRPGSYGDWDDDIVINEARTNTLRITSALQDTPVAIPRLTLDGSENIEIDHLEIYGEYAGATGCVINVSGCSNINIHHNEIHSNPLADAVMQASIECLDGVGNTSGGGLAVDGITLANNHIHDVSRGFRFTGANVDVTDNLFEDAFQSFGEFGNTDNHTFLRNRGIGIWAHQADPGLPHSALLGFTTQTHMLDGSTIMWNILMVGTNRFDAKGDVQGYATGPKYNDYSGAGGYTNVRVAANLFAPNGGLGLEISGCNNTVVENNTIVMDPETYNDSDIVSLYWTDNDANTIFRNNVAMNMDEGAVGQSDLTLYDGSFNNICVRNSLTADDADPISFASQFDGPSFSNLTLANVQAAFTPKAGSALLTGSIYQAGCFGTDYYDWDTYTEDLPTFTKPAPTTATGATPTPVVFDGSAARGTVTDATDPFIGVTDGTKLSFRVDATILTESTDAYFLNATGAALVCRRLATNIIRFTLENAAGTTILQAETSLRLRTSDPHTVWFFSFDLTNFKYRVAKGPVIDPFVNVSVWKGGSWNTGLDVLYLMSAVGGGNYLHAEIGEVWLADDFLDIETVANFNKVVAVNGDPINSGADGKTLSANCRLCAKGNAAAWNADTLNLANASFPVVITGSLTDA